MFCTHCGKQINDGVAFCQHCGKSQQLNQVSAQAPTQQPLAPTAPSANIIAPQAETVLTMGTPKLLQVVQIANSVITPYVEALENYEHLVKLQQWCEDYAAEKKRVKLKYNTPDHDDYGWSGAELHEYNRSRRIYVLTTYDFSTVNYIEQWGFVKRAIKKNAIASDIAEAKQNLLIPKQNLEANIEYINLIPPTYRYPLALSEIQFYLENFRAENWKEAVEVYEEQLHRWQVEANSEQALELQVQTALLAGEAASWAGTAALFSGLSFFFK